MCAAVKSVLMTLCKPKPCYWIEIKMETLEFNEVWGGQSKLNNKSRDNDVGREFQLSRCIV